jgi:H+/Cl- antiporter ClcA
MATNAQRNGVPGWRMRPRQRPEFPGLLLFLSGIFLAVTGLFFYWFLDSRLPWLAKTSPCRGAFLVILPVTATFLILLGLAVRDWRKRRQV